MSSNIPPSLGNAGFQTMTLSNSTAIAINGTIRALQPSALDISVETQSARYRMDGTDPALTTGVLLTAGRYRFEQYNRTSQLAFQRSTGTCIVQIQAYKYPGDG